jgi:hypothetical protein
MLSGAIGRASAINTNIVKLRTYSNGCLPFKANDHENSPYVGISRMRRFRMVDRCKGKRKLWLQGTDDVVVVGLHMVGKRVKVSSLNNVTSFLTLYFSFLSLDPPLSYLYCYLIFLFFFFFFHSFILIFFSHIYFFLSFFLFFSILILFSLFFSLLTTFQSSQLLSLLHAYNLKF